MSGSGLPLLSALLPWARRRPHIFISYRRRGDSAGFAARLADRLVAHFGDDQCFRDIEDIETGADFVEAIEDAVASSRVMVVVIGTDWATVTDARGRRRLDNPDDFVRIEVATALRRGIRVIPALVAGATMPSGEGLPVELQGLWRRQALELTDTRWDYDVGQLTAAIEAMGIKSREKRTAALFARRLRWGGVAVAGVALVGLGLVLSEVMARGASNGPNTLLDGSAAAAPSVGASDAGGGAPAEQARDQASQKVDPPAERSAPPSSTRPSTQASAPRPSAVERYRAALVEAINYGNEEQNHAQQTLDVTGLADAFTGQAYQLHLAAVAQLFQLGIVSVNTLLAQEFGEFWVDPTETVARVEVVERWTSEFRSAITGACVSRVPPWDVPQTVQLRRDGGDWIIESVELSALMPDALPC